MQPNQATNEQTEVGYVVSSREFLVYLEGFPSIRVNDMVESDTGARGWVNSISAEKVEVLMVDEAKILPKQMFRKIPTRLSLAVGDFLIGRSINPLGIPIDGKGPLSKTKTTQISELEKTAPGVETREFITKQFLTGITIIDSLIPLGLGQRELVLGDAHSGKTGFLTDIIINQKNSGIICILALIGKPSVVVKNLIEVLKNNKAMDYTVVIATSSSETAPLIFLTPKTAFAVAEYFQSKGRDVLIILDDLGSHAKIHREISLLGNKAPGRESYPGDMFYQHAHLLERAGNFLPAAGGGSISALPVIELSLNDFTTLIPTNLMSMTDGHLMFKSAMRSQGQVPAIDISLSVSRVGRQTQTHVSNLLSTKVRQVLSDAADLETIARFSAELPPETQLILKRRELIMEVLKQEPLSYIPKEVQMILLALIFTTFFSDKTGLFVEKYKNPIAQAFATNPKLIPITRSLEQFKSEDDLIKTLEGVGPILATICQPQTQ